MFGGKQKTHRESTLIQTIEAVETTSTQKPFLKHWTFGKPFQASLMVSYFAA